MSTNGNVQQTNQSGQSGILQQVLMSFVWVFLIYLALIFVELIYKYINRLSINRTVLMRMINQLLYLKILIFQVQKQCIFRTMNEVVLNLAMHSIYMSIHPLFVKSKDYFISFIRDTAHSFLY